MIQLLFSALYTKLIEASQSEDKSDEAASNQNSQQQKSSICNILAEAICFIDEDNKHTDAINALIQQARDSQRISGWLEGDDVDDAVGLSFVSTIKVNSIEICKLLL